MKAILILLFSIFQFASAKTDINKRKFLVPKSNLPVEINFLIQSLHMSKLSPIEKRILDQSLIKMDQAFEQLSKEEIFFIIKTEAYKSVLKNKPDLQIQKASYNKKILNYFDSYIEKDAISPFAKWALYSIKSDLEELLESSLFATWLVRKKYNNPLDNKLRRLEKKLNLLLPWYEYIKMTEPKDFDAGLKDMMLSLLDKINLYTLQLLSYSSPTPIEISPLRPTFKFFEEREFDLEKKTEFVQTLEKVVDSVLKDQKPVTLPTPVNDWLPKDDGSLPENARAYPTPDPNYKAPEDLPKPVDDWFDEI
jgi:hypothetical protein